jgi:hypothetical protein
MIGFIELTQCDAKKAIGGAAFFHFELARSFAFTVPAMPTLRPKLRKIPRRSLSIPAL